MKIKVGDLRRIIKEEAGRLARMPRDEHEAAKVLVASVNKRGSLRPDARVAAEQAASLLGGMDKDELHSLLTSSGMSRDNADHWADVLSKPGHTSVGRTSMRRTLP